MKTFRRFAIVGLIIILGAGLLLMPSPADTQDQPTLPPRNQTRTQAAVNRAGTQAVIGATATQKKANFAGTATQKAIGATQAAQSRVDDRALCPNTRLKCNAITSCPQAFACLRLGNKALDKDRDGVPCENLCPGG